MQITQCNLDGNEAGATPTLETTLRLRQNALPASLETTETDSASREDRVA